MAGSLVLEGRHERAQGQDIDCDEDGLSLLGRRGVVAGRRLWWVSCTACLGTVLLLGATVGHFQDVGGSFRGSDVVELAAEDNCADYFRGFQDCSPLNYWQCSGDDGSWGYRCCCINGFGEFGETKKELTGMIALSARADLCLDVSTPYAIGAEYTSGPFIVQVCAWGDPNKQFHMPKSGTGQIRWAGHPALCMVVQDGMNANGESLHLADCYTVPLWWTHFTVIPGKKQIRWAAHPDKCVRANDFGNGAQVTLGYCDEKDSNQHMEVLPPHAMPKKDAYPTLFCLSLMLPFGSEPKLMREQFARGIGIFECHDSAIYSNTSVELRHNNRSFPIDIMPGSMVVQFGGQWHSALNTDIFIRFWGKVVQDHRAWSNSWTVKLDPDTVFFPSRLQQLISSMWKKENDEEEVFLNNCHLGMHGPIEVISQKALAVYKKRWQECKKGFPYTHKQEDFYFRVCWRMLGIKEVDVFNLLQENAFACDERASTRDGRHPCFSKQVSFHPFKTAESYWECHRRGARMTWATPLLPVSEIPSRVNNNHG